MAYPRRALPGLDDAERGEPVERVELPLPVPDMNIDNDSKPRQQKGFRLETLESELLLYDPDKTKTIYLNPTASLIWQMCDGQHSVADIVSLLQESYPEAADGIPDDVAAALDQFVEHGAIEIE